MDDAVRFLNSWANALATMTLYQDGHPARERAIDAAFEDLQDLQTPEARQRFTFLGDEVVFGTMPLRELKTWGWGPRLAEVGLQRLEFDAVVSRDEFLAFLDDVYARVNLEEIDTSEVRQMRRSSIKMGPIRGAR